MLKYFVTLFDPFGFPLRFARCVNVFSGPDLSFASTENGKPFWRVPMPMMDYPLTAASTPRLAVVSSFFPLPIRRL